MIAEVWQRGLWWHKQGLTLEQARVLYTDREMWQAETYWRIEATVNSRSVPSEQENATEAAFQAMKANKKRRQ